MEREELELVGRSGYAGLSLAGDGKSWDWLGDMAMLGLAEPGMGKEELGLVGRYDYAGLS